MQSNSKFKPILAILPVILAALLCACNPNTETEEEQRQDKTPRVALVMKSLANEFFTNMADGARQHQAINSKDYELIVNGIKNESDLALQVTLVEQMIASRVDAIVIAPADSKGLLPVIQRAITQGILVVNIDNRFDQDLLQEMNLSIPFVGPDNRKGAKKVGAYLADQLNSDDEVAILGGVPGAFNAQQRQLGFEDAIAEKGLTIVSSQSAGWEQAKAATIASALLSEYPNLKAIFAANDSMALGAVAAIRQADRASQVKVVGFDNISAAKSLIRSGEMLATVEQYGDKLAVFGIEYALNQLNSPAQIAADRQTPVDLITAEQLPK